MLRYNPEVRCKNLTFFVLFVTYPIYKPLNKKNLWQVH